MSVLSSDKELEGLNKMKFITIALGTFVVVGPTVVLFQLINTDVCNSAAKLYESAPIAKLLAQILLMCI